VHQNTILAWLCLDLQGAYGTSPDSVAGLYGYCGKGGEVRKMGGVGGKEKGE